jgi:16S rRNA (cytosine967-C5)-methyltransferase
MSKHRTGTSKLSTDSLAFALTGAARAVALVDAGTALPQALARVFAQTDATPQARGAIQDVAYRTMRQQGLADELIALTTAKMPEAPLRALLRCALTLMCTQDDAYGKAYEPYTVVDQAVTAAGADELTMRAKGMINAVLRRFLRERESLLEQARAKPTGRWNYPAWWITAMRAAYPQNWEAILDAGNRPPPLTLRVNVRKTTVDAYLALLAENGMEAQQIGPQAVKLARPLPVERIPGFADGLASVQDAAAQQAAPLLDLRDGMRVLDACAAPGGKTGHILESADVDLLALDIDPERLRRVTENLERLQLRAHLRAGNAASGDWWDGMPFDRIVADVPCTASGVVRRHPDIRWLRRERDVNQLATLSARILDNLWRMLLPGGKFLLVTCSLWPQESEGQALAFAARHGAVRLPAPGQLLPAAEEERDHDGLFYALFQKPGAAA